MQDADNRANRLQYKHDQAAQHESSEKDQQVSRAKKQLEADRQRLNDEIYEFHKEKGRVLSSPSDPAADEYTREVIDGQARQIKSLQLQNATVKESQKKAKRATEACVNQLIHVYGPLDTAEPPTGGLGTNVATIERYVDQICAD